MGIRGAANSEAGVVRLHGANAGAPGSRCETPHPRTAVRVRSCGLQAADRGVPAAVRVQNAVNSAAPQERCGGAVDGAAPSGAGRETSANLRSKKRRSAALLTSANASR